VAREDIGGPLEDATHRPVKVDAGYGLLANPWDELPRETHVVEIGDEGVGVALADLGLAGALALSLLVGQDPVVRARRFPQGQASPHEAIERPARSDGGRWWTSRGQFHRIARRVRHQLRQSTRGGASTGRFACCAEILAAIHTGEPPRLYTDLSQFRYRDTSKIRGHIEAAYEASGRFLDELAR
jgi:hypothetical protein